MQKLPPANLPPEAMPWARKVEDLLRKQGQSERGVRTNLNAAQQTSGQITQSVITKLSGLLDVDATNTVDGYVLTYDSDDQKARWEPTQVPGEEPKVELNFAVSDMNSNTYEDNRRTVGTVIDIGSDTIINRMEVRVEPVQDETYILQCWRMSDFGYAALIGQVSVLNTEPTSTTTPVVLDSGPVSWELDAGYRYAFVTHTASGASVIHKANAPFSGPLVIAGLGVVPNPGGLVFSNDVPTVGGVVVTTFQESWRAQVRLSTQVEQNTAAGAEFYLSPASVSAATGWRTVVVDQAGLRGPAYELTSTPGEILVKESGWFSVSGRVHLDDGTGTLVAGDHGVNIDVDGVRVSGDIAAGPALSVGTDCVVFITGGQRVRLRYYSSGSVPVYGGTTGRTFLRIAKASGPRGEQGPPGESTATFTLGELTDVNVAGAAADEVLRYDGSFWVSDRITNSMIDALDASKLTGSLSRDRIPDALITQDKMLDDEEMAGITNPLFRDNGAGWVAIGGTASFSSGSGYHGDPSVLLSAETVQRVVYLGAENVQRYATPVTPGEVRRVSVKFRGATTVPATAIRIFARVYKEDGSSYVFATNGTGGITNVETTANVYGEVSGLITIPADYTRMVIGFGVQPSFTGAVRFSTPRAHRVLTSDDYADLSVTLPKLATAGAATGQVPTYNGSSVVWQTPPSAGGGGSSSGAMMTLNAASLPAAVSGRVVLLDTVERIDSGFTYDPATGELTCQIAGWYSLSGHVRLTALLTGGHALTIRKNGVDSLRSEVANASRIDFIVSGEDYLEANDKVTLYMTTTTNGAIAGGNRSYTYLRAVRL